jgi:hypothetical protein
LVFQQSTGSKGKTKANKVIPPIHRSINQSIDQSMTQPKKIAMKNRKTKKNENG